MSWTVYNSSGQLLQATDLPDDVVGVAELSATGTASSSTFLRGDNAWAAPAGGPSQANQAALEAETNEDTYAPPDLVKHSPGVAKAWCSILSAGTLQAPDYNIASVTDSGVGARIINFDTDFSTAIYSCTGVFNAPGAVAGAGDLNVAEEMYLADFLVGSVEVWVRNVAGVVDVGSSHVFHGDQ